VALIKKVKAADKENATCLGGLLDRVSPLNQNNGGRGNNNRGNFNNFNFNNNAKKTNGQAFCMTARSDSQRSIGTDPEGTRQGQSPAGKGQGNDRRSLHEIPDQGSGRRVANHFDRKFCGNRGGGNNANRNTNPQLVIQSGTDEIYKKAARC
jgi:hypothetical protein